MLIPIDVLGSDPSNPDRRIAIIVIKTVIIISFNNGIKEMLALFILM